MGRHTAPITIVPPERPATTAPVQVTDPRLLDSRRSAPRAAARRIQPPVPAPRSVAPRLPSDDESDVEVDEIPVAVDRLSARSVLEAQARAAADEQEPVRLPRARDLCFAGASLAVLVVAVGATFLP